MKKTPDRETTRPGAAEAQPATPRPDQPPRKPAPEFGGPSGPEPTRYGDWERNGRVSDF
ncbi:succinate dehydrogenase assembly factor 4 [Dongia sp.]|uniref:succinate dehydrogenase assembly factor 4 n=1 Tax=Dongia sp. TaxID=1977262 RepID=UPI0035ADAEDA